MQPQAGVMPTDTHKQNSPPQSDSWKLYQPTAVWLEEFLQTSDTNEMETENNGEVLRQAPKFNINLGEREMKIKVTVQHSLWDFCSAYY